MTETQRLEAQIAGQEIRHASAFDSAVDAARSALLFAKRKKWRAALACAKAMETYASTAVVASGAIRELTIELARQKKKARG